MSRDVSDFHNMVTVYYATQLVAITKTLMVNVITALRVVLPVIHRLIVLLVRQDIILSLVTII